MVTGPPTDTGDYQTWIQEGDAVFSILIYSVWGFMGAQSPTEPTFFRGRPADANIDPLIWGGLYASSFKGREAFNKWIQTRWYFYMLAYFLIDGIFPEIPGVDELVMTVAGFGCLALGLIIHYFCVWRLDRDMRDVVNEVNPILSEAGYRVAYKVEPTSYCYSNEHRFYIFATRTKTALAPPNELLNVVTHTPPPVPQVPLPVQPVTVHLHAPWYLYVFEWTTCKKHPNLFHDDCPAELQPIHPFIWGALVDAFYVFDLEQMRIQRFWHGNTLFILVLYASSRLRNGKTWWIVPVVAASLMLLQFFCFERAMDKLSRGQCHSHWQQAVNTWQPILSQQGWQLEYHGHDDDLTANTATRNLWCHTPPASNVQLRFVPVSVLNTA